MAFEEDIPVGAMKVIRNRKQFRKLQRGGRQTQNIKYSLGRVRL